MRDYSSLIGKRFGKLLVIEQDGKIFTNTAWKCLCDCGNYKTVKRQYLTQGKTKSCGCNAHPVSGSGNAACNKLYGDYKIGAKARNLEFNITIEQFAELTKKDCVICKIKPSRINKYFKIPYPYNGLDRIDNKKGYLIDNVQPMCYQCNKAKGNWLDSEFKDWLKRIKENYDG